MLAASVVDATDFSCYMIIKGQSMTQTVLVMWIHLFITLQNTIEVDAT